MLKRKNTDGFNLAFLDVMACGLGAIILIFMLVDFQSYDADPQEEVKRMEAELFALDDEKTELQKSLDDVNDKISLFLQGQEDSQQSVGETRVKQQQLQQAIAQEIAVVAELEDQLAATHEQVTASDNISLDGTGEQNYLIGLKVDQQNIAILVDKSASMLDETLSGVLRARAKPATDKQLQSKWLRTKRIVQWILARAPANATVTLYAFSEDVVRLGNADRNAISRQGELQAMLSDLSKLVPEGGTNLEQGLLAINKANPNMQELYVITDGLPTKGTNRSLSNKAKCASFFGRSNTISGECRASLMQSALQIAPAVRTNIVLLPMEGDPQAPDLFWRWSKSTYGMMIAPEGKWP